MLRAASGEAGIVIGTHALLEEHVQFADLGLVVVDEQHRFGVEQRAALTDKAGTPPHVLVMTATPIPRTVAMTVFGDLETSTLTELPGRPRGRSRPTSYRSPTSRSWVDRACGAGCARRSSAATRPTSCARASRATSSSRARPTSPTTTTTDDPARPRSRLSAVEEVVEELRAGPLAGLRRRAAARPAAPDDKDRAMRAFAAGEIDVLVSTTVIEVGVDVANATTMVLLDADRFGISQLHQLRGRVGRGGLPGLCLLVTARRGRHPRTRAARRRRRHHRRLRAQPGRPRAAPRGRRARPLAVRLPELGLQNLRVLRDEKTIVEAREAATALLAADPGPRPGSRAAAAG